MLEPVGVLPKEKPPGTGKTRGFGEAPLLAMSEPNPVGEKNVTIPSSPVIVFRVAVDRRIGIGTPFAEPSFDVISNRTDDCKGAKPPRGSCEGVRP
mmetsp:Transcript_1969/g.5894  ORF Transcript_1969/g.5894 Transcript_1969/m.5894 type:complete len:96 (+) Transcript_1969:582-869(+)